MQLDEAVPTYQHQFIYPSLFLSFVSPPSASARSYQGLIFALEIEKTKG